ncbi:hypothetical protein RRF57_002968 [Xylaria bambusicola]|uniref:Uncharacterized protein n=1 Tax=Xylaria bambusicola TaxID=326684 RepID=A0AAN7UED7_9PEZI
MNIHHNGFYNPFEDIQDAHTGQGRRPIANAYEHYAGSIISPESSPHQKDTSNTPAILAPNLSVCVGSSAHTTEIFTDGIGAAHRHERDRSDFSFKAGDDFDPLPKKPTEEERGLEDLYLENSGVKRQQRYSSDIDRLATISAPVEEQTPSVKGNSPGTHTSTSNHHVEVNSPPTMPIQRYRDPGYSPTTVGKSHDRSNCSANSLPVTAAMDQDVSQAHKTDARIAARLALANILDSTKQRK